MNLEEEYKKYLAYSQEELFAIGVETGQQLIELMDMYFGDQDRSFAQFIKIYGSFSSIDWKITKDEYDLFIKLTGVSASFNEFVKAVKDSYDIDSMMSVDKFIDENPYDFKPLVMKLGLVICAYDGEITLEEKALLEKYLA